MLSVLGHGRHPYVHLGSLLHITTALQTPVPVMCFRLTCQYARSDGAVLLMLRHAGPACMHAVQARCIMACMQIRYDVPICKLISLPHF